MIKDIIDKWNANSEKLRIYFQTTDQTEYSDYKDIVVKIFELCINVDGAFGEEFDLNKMTIINDGDYQGTIVFIIPKKIYQPDANDYLVTDTYYGSCSGCDTLQGISAHHYGIPTDVQVNNYMTLALHLVQKMRWLAVDDIQ